MKLSGDVSLVGSGRTGFALSSPADCHVYLLDAGDELVLIDAGVGGSVGDSERILRNISDDGYDPSKISRILLTHYHADHMGGAAEMHERLGCPIHGSPLTADTLRTGNEEQISLPGAKLAGYFPADFTLRSAPCTGDLIDGQSFTVGRFMITPIETPGHADGHVSLLVEGGERTYLLQGDVVFFGGTILLQNTHDCSIQKYAASVARLATIEFDAFLPGHLGISLQDGKRHIDAAHAVFSALGVPRNLG
jgi:glyoxylase-like metal-dependent hydrolase (beta-lactamase superfamily II)